MVTRIKFKENFENSQEIRDQHWRDGNYTVFGINGGHRTSCVYCYKRMRGLELPKIKVILIHPDKDGYEEREVFDKHDPRATG